MEKHLSITLQTLALFKTTMQNDNIYKHTRRVLVLPSCYFFGVRFKKKKTKGCSLKAQADRILFAGKETFTFDIHMHAALHDIQIHMNFILHHKIPSFYFKLSSYSYFALS